SAIIFIADDMAEKSWLQNVPAMSRGLYDITGGPSEKVLAREPIIWVHNSELNFIQSASNITANIIVEHFEYPSVNIIGKIEGTDSKLSKE
ncbi:hypothetical protein ABTK34_19305, partial [Acinetobacter baumannii]